MTTAPNALQARLQQVAATAKTRDEKAEKIIWGNVLFNAGMGWVPVGINTWTFVGANVTTTVALGHLYGFTLDRAQAAALIRQIIGAVGLTWAATTLGLKFFAEILKGAGVISMGGTTMGGMMLDAALSGAISYALGYTAAAYFRNGCTLDAETMRDVFRHSYAEGRGKVQQAVKDKMAGKPS